MWAFAKMFDDSHAMVSSNDGGWQKGQLSNPILSELGWLDIGHRETKRLAPAPEKWGENPGSLEMNRTWRFSIMFGVYVYVFGMFFCSILAVRFPDPPVNSLHLGGLKMRDPSIFRFHPLPNLTETLHSATKSLWCPNVVNDNWHVWADFDWFWKNVGMRCVQKTSFAKV